MYQNVSINWDVFNYKFSGNTRNAFEQLAYILFCHEFGRPFGIFRYFNQTGIETEVIQVDEDIIGFQAKYYDANITLSNRKADLIAAIDKSRQSYPNITRMLFYVNKELALSKKKGQHKPQYQIEIENHGKQFGINIEWRVKSNFEVSLFSPEMTHVRDFFFNPNEGIKGYLDHIQRHTKTIVGNINSTIQNNGVLTKIEHDDFDLDSFIGDENSKYLIIFGNGGSGKSGLIKDSYTNVPNEIPFFVFKATDFEAVNISEFSRKFGDYTFEDFLSMFNDDDKKIFVIDSVEKVFTMNNKDVLKDIIRLLVNHGWKIIFTIRTVYKDNFINYVLRLSEYQEYEVKDITISQLEHIFTRHTISLPFDIKIKILLCNLFYLQVYMNTTHSQGELNETIEDFKERIWNEKIKNIVNAKNNIHLRRETAICKMVFVNANNGTSYYILSKDEDHEAISALENDEIIAFDSIFDGYYLTHDVYEEWVLKRVIQSAFTKNHRLIDFFCSIGNSLIMRKMFRLWIHDQIDMDAVRLSTFLNEALENDNLDSIWKDEILISLMNDERQLNTLYLVESMFNNDQFSLLLRAVFLLNTACKVIDVQVLNTLLTQEEQKTFNVYRYTKPSGTGWAFIFKFINDNFDRISWDAKNIMTVTDSLSTWVNNHKTGIETKHAGLIALNFYDIIKSSNHLGYTLRDRKLKSIISVILGSALETHVELTHILQEVIDNEENDHRSKYYDLSTQLLEGVVDSYALCEANPDIVIGLANCFWKRNDKESEFPRYYRRDSIEDAFDVNSDTQHDFYPTSAHHTPIFQLLRVSPQKAIEFIIDFFNHVTKSYSNSFLEKEYNECSTIYINLPNGKVIEQTASSRLWLMHRGTSTAPNLLESMLMALERWLLFFVKQADRNQAEGACYELLSKSHSAAITSVVVSAVISYPEKLFEIACILLKTKEVFDFDVERSVQENHANLFRGLPSNKLYDDERIASNNLDFRKKKFEDIILEYQFQRHDLAELEFSERVKTLYQTIDIAFSDIPDEDTLSRFVLHRIDLRKMNFDTDAAIEKNGTTYIPLVSDLPDDLKEISRITKEQTDTLYKHTPMAIWAKARFENDVQSYNKYSNFEENPLIALEEMKEILSEKNTSDYNYLTRSAPVYVSAVLVRDFPYVLTEDQRKDCEQFLTLYSKFTIQQQRNYQIGDGSEAAIASLPIIINGYKQSVQGTLDEPAVILLALLMDVGDLNKAAVKSFSSKAWEICRSHAEQLFVAYIRLKPEYDLNVLVYNGISPIKFLKKKRKVIKKLMNSTPNINDLDFSKLGENALLTASMLLSPSIESTHAILKQVGPITWQYLFQEDHLRDRNVHRSYKLESAYIDWLAKYIFNLPNAHLRQSLIRDFIPYITSSDYMEQLLCEITVLQDNVKQDEVFWDIWDKLYVPIVNLCEKQMENDKNINRERYYGRGLDEIVTTYALAFPWWNKDMRSWHTLKPNNTIFFKRLATDIGYNPVILYAVSRVLNTIGYNYIEEGLNWLFIIIKNNPHLKQIVLQVNTEYYIEEFMRRYTMQFEADIKKYPEIREKVICILSFLVDRGSTSGFMLRESIA
ncbi:hypothetical protein AWU65_28155 [Paenibacillus glucanolyticus]|uniref:ATP-binding protein n=1 Tax=Paenibacillus glucanolyticus TaxID=59843 RepID=A0A163EQR6_9BACL|nr:AVAST type 4 anti-phage nuclease Avs4 [Paenibacillus glucanolyticus]KZS43952.1 hypothetical protein AWU65_28155 [Paenibacillus glucanolyticus]